MGGSPFLPRADRDALVLRQRGISLASHMTTVWVDCSYGEINPVHLC